MMKHFRSKRDSEARAILHLNNIHKLLQGRYCKPVVKSSTQRMLDQRKKMQEKHMRANHGNKKEDWVTESRKWHSCGV